MTTETRIEFDDENSCRNFGRYWGVIYPGSSLHRVYLLETVRHRAEAAPSPDDRSDVSFREGWRSGLSAVGTVSGERKGS